MADTVYVKKVGTDSSPIFSAQVVSDSGAQSFRQIPVTNVSYVSPASQAQITEFISNNAPSQTNEQLVAGAAVIAQRNFDQERANIAGVNTANGIQNTTEPSLASKIFSTINPFSSNFLGMDLGPKPDPTPNLVGQSNSGSKAVTKAVVNKPTPKLDPYTRSTRDINKDPSYREVIGGADMAVFFMMSYPSTDLDNGMLPKDQQNMEHVIIEIDNALSLSYQTLREVFPVRNMGTINPAAHIKGIRTITGNMAFAIFTDDPLAYLRSQVADQMTQINTNFTSFKEMLDKTDKTDSSYDEKLAKWQDYQRYYQSFINQADKAQLLDNLEPFTILVMGTNEQGASSKMMLREVSVIDENQYQGTQQPHAINKITFSALDIVPMARFEDGQIAISSIDSIDTTFLNGRLNSRINYNNEVTGTKALKSMNADFYKSNRIGG